MEKRQPQEEGGRGLIAAVRTLGFKNSGAQSRMGPNLIPLRGSPDCRAQLRDCEPRGCQDGCLGGRGVVLLPGTMDTVPCAEK